MPTTIHDTRSKTVALGDTTTAPEQIIRPVALRVMSMRPAYLETSAWFEHIPFAFWLIEAHRPRQMVELGTHHGTSYFAFCQAVERLGLDTRCFAVDTWKGDEHAGFYGEEVFEKVSAYNDAQYSSFSRLVRSTFDDALKHFSDGTVDLLHIDGLHTLEVVRHDFETWLPKLSERAVVVMHDTNVRERNFGVFRLFEELRERYPFFEFVHGHGLGVLGVGEEQNEQLRRLFQAQDETSARRTVHDVFSRLGRACADAGIAGQRRLKNRELQNAVAGHKKKIEDLQKALGSAKNEREQRSAELAEIRSRLRQQSEQQAIERGRLAERAGLLQERGAELGEEIRRLRARAEKSEAALKEGAGALERSHERVEEHARRLTELQEERNRLLARVEESEAALKESTDALERGRRSDDERGNRLTELEEERDRLQLENGKLTKNVQTRFDEIAKLTRMLLEAEGSSATLKTRVTTNEARAVKFLAEIARLDRSVEVLASQGRSSGGAPSGPAVRSLEVLKVAEDPVLLDTSLQGESEVSVELTLFGDVEDRRAAAASLITKAFDSQGKVLAGTRWIGNAATKRAPPSLKSLAGRYRWRSRRSELPQDSCVLVASPEGESFSACLSLPAGATRVRMECRRLVNGCKLLLIRGNSLLSDRPVEPNEKLDIRLNVRSERPLKRALTLVPQFLDAEGKLLPPPYDGFLSDETRLAFSQLAAGKTGRLNTLRTTAPDAAARLRLLLQPALARGRLEIVEAEPLEQREIVWSMVKKPTPKGKVEVALTLLGPRDEPQAALFVPTFYAAGGKKIPGPYEGFESSDQFAAFRYLPAGPAGTRMDVTLTVPPGTRKCRLDIVPWKLDFGLRVEAGPVAEEAAHIDGALLPAEGITLERDMSADAKLWFKLRVTGARDLESAGLCAVTYLDAAGEALPLPYAGLKVHGERGAVLPFGASRKPTGRVTGIHLEPPLGTVKARLRFIPNDADDALCIRIEPMPNKRSIIKLKS